MQTAPKIQVKLSLPQKFRGWKERSQRYKVAYGGRGSAKSWSIAQLLILEALESKKLILCAREIQKSIDQSVLKLLSVQIERMGLSAYFDVQNTKIKCFNGSEFVFGGLRTNIDSIKSMEGIDIVWVEEAQNVSFDSWETLIPTIRKEGSEIWVSFNPKKEEDDTYQRFVANAGDDVLLVNINWNDNPYFPEVLDKERLKLKAANDSLYRHVWEGAFLKDGDKTIWTDDNFADYYQLPYIEYIEIVGDTASEDKESNDFSVFTVVGMSDTGDIYILDCVYGKWEINLLRQQAISVWNKHNEGISSMKPAASIMAIEDASSGKQLCQMLENTVIPIERIQRKRKASDEILVEQETRKWKRSSQAMLYMNTNNKKIHLPVGEPWVDEFKRQMKSVELMHCGSETGFGKRGTWDIPDTMADAIYRNMITGSAGLDASVYGLG